jgi:hypothetical protein
MSSLIVKPLLAKRSISPKSLRDVDAGRKYTAGSGYRYGFNGQEKSDEIGGEFTTAEYWEYDSRIGRRWNVDPEVQDNESPYVCFSDNPIFFSDLLGNTSGAQQPGPKQPEPVNLNASQTSKAITTSVICYTY